MACARDLLVSLTPPLFNGCLLLAPIFLILTIAAGGAQEQYIYAEQRTVYITVRVYNGHEFTNPSQSTGILIHENGYVLTVRHIIPDHWQGHLSNKALWHKLDFRGRLGGPRSREQQLLPVQVGPEGEDALLLKIAEAPSAKKFRYFSVESTAAIPASVVSIVGFPNLTDRLRLRPTSLSAPCTPAESTCSINLKLTTGYSGSPVILDDGRTVGGMIVTTSTDAHNAESKFIHAARLYRWLNSVLPRSNWGAGRKVALAYLVGFDGARAYVQAKQGKDVLQLVARVNQFLQRLKIDSVTFPEDLIGPEKEGWPANKFSKLLLGTLEGRDRQLQLAFIVGWFGVLEVKLKIRPDWFNLRQFAQDAGFDPHPKLSDKDYLNSIEDVLRPKVAE